MTPSFLLFLKLAYHSIAHAVGKALWSLRTRFWSHVQLQACICNGTKRCSIPRRLGRKHMQVLALQVHVTDGAQLAKVKSKQHPRVFPVDSHLLLNSAQLWSSITSSAQSWLVSISAQTHSIGSGSPAALSPTVWTSLDTAPASFDALRLESRVVCCETM